jgi:hypothetical protein
LAIFVSDVAIIVAVLTIGQNTRDIMRRRESKPLIQSESPLAWIEFCILASFLSILTSLVYVFMNGFSIATDAPIIGNQSLLVFSISFFLMGLIYLVRTAIFLVHPSSRANIFAGKLIYRVADVSMRVILLSFVAFVQVFNGLMFQLIVPNPVLQRIFSTPITILYAFTIVLSFIGMVPIACGIVFHPYQQVKRRDLVFIASFLSPWIVFSIIGTLLSIGIKLV